MLTVKQSAAKLAKLVVLVVALMAALVYFLVIKEEIGRNITQQLVTARRDIAAIDAAVVRFKRRNGRLPTSLLELSDASLVGNEEVLFVPESPWGGDYYYRRERLDGFQSYDVWTIPDAHAQSKIGLNRLSIHTNWNDLLP
jgi:hypothetical protein